MSHEDSSNSSQQENLLYCVADPAQIRKAPLRYIRGCLAMRMVRDECNVVNPSFYYTFKRMKSCAYILHLWRAGGRRHHYHRLAYGKFGLDVWTRRELSSLVVCAIRGKLTTTEDQHKLPTKWRWKRGLIHMVKSCALTVTCGGNTPLIRWKQAM